jgi:hypothetical protein
VFIQVVQGKCTRQDELRAHGDAWVAEISPHAEGWLGGTFGFTDDDTFVGVVRFESREAAMANSERPEQQEWARRADDLMDGPMEFHDCDRVLVMLDGGSDNAGFVQVIRGKIDDPSRLEASLDEMGEVLREARPEIIGATFALEEDGTFTQTVSFTDEAAAREGERSALPENDGVRELMEEWGRITHDVRYLDLRHPWFASRS